MPRRWLLTIVAVVAVTLIALRPELRYHDSDEIKPESFTVTTGGTRVIADGRAQIWLNRVDLKARSEQGALHPVAEFELVCGGETHKKRIPVNTIGREICGCHIRLVEIYDTTPPSVRFEISRNVEEGAEVQAASAFAPPGRR